MEPWNHKDPRHVRAFGEFRRHALSQIVERYLAGVRF
jgi:hypothetical protein